MIRNLRDYITALQKEAEIVKIDALVDPYLEVAEIHRRVILESGPALLFTNVKGSSFPLVTNLFGTEKRIELAFGKRPENLVRSIAALPLELMPPTIGKLWDKRSLLWDLTKVGVKNSALGPVTTTHSKTFDLNTLPLLTTWEQDGGAFFTLPLVYTEHPKTKQHNLGMYRMQRFDSKTTGFHAQIGKGAGYHLAAARDLDQDLPAVMFLGGPPSLILSAIAPLPENVPELMLASLVLGQKLNITRSKLTSLPLISESEFAFVGHVSKDELRPEGPFGDHYGYYSLKHDYPVFHVKNVFHRENPIVPATVVGKPRQEDFYLGDYLQKLLSPLFPLVMPAVEDLWSYGETGYHSLAAAVVKQRYKRECMASAFRILGEGQLSLTKFLFVLDKQIDLRDFKSVLTHLLERANFATDLYVFSNLSMDTLDYTGPAVNEGSKGVLLGVGDPIRALPSDLPQGLPSLIQNAKVFSPGCLLISIDRNSQDIEALCKLDGLADWPLLILVDDVAKASMSTESFLWTTFTRFEPGADIYSRGREILRNHIAYKAPILIDARMKPGYPDELECDPKTKALVDSRWREYFR